MARRAIAALRLRGEFTGPALATRTAALLLASASAHAQTGTATEALETVTVTATRRVEDIQKVPMAVSAFGAEELASRNATRLDDVLISVPNVSYSQGSSTRASYISIRGVQGSNEEPAVGLYLDNVYIGKRAAQSLDFIDPQSVQVLKGPQGSLYGKNTLGGVVIVETRRPNLDKPNMFVEATAGSHELLGARFSASTPLADGTALLLGGRASTRDGYFHNVLDGSDVGDRDNYGFVSGLRMLKGAFELNLTADYSHDRTQGQVFKIARFRDTFTFAPPVLPATVFGPNQYVADQESYDVSQDQRGHETRNVRGIAANLSVDFEGFSLRSTSAYRGFDIWYGADSDGMGIPILFPVQNQNDRQYSQELTLLSDTGGRIDWIAGASWYRERFEYFALFVDPTARALGIKPLLLAGLTPFGLQSQSDTLTHSYAAYAEATFHITDQWSVRTGVRWAKDDREIDKVENYTARYGTPTQIPLGAPFVPAAFPANPLVIDQTRSDSAVIPDLVLQYQLNDDIGFYAKASGSYRPGGFNDSPGLTTAIQYEKEKAWNYELGFRSAWLDNRVMLNLTAFHLDWKDLQVTVSCTTGFCTSNARAHSNGLEFESRFQLARALELGLAAAWLKDAQFDGTDYRLQARNPATGVNAGVLVDGVRLARAPEFSGSAYAQYTHEFGADHSLALRADVNYKDAELIVQARPDFASPSYTEINLSATYTAGPFAVRAWGKNLRDRGYWNFGNSAVFGDVFTLSDPRTYGLTLSYRY